MTTPCADCGVPLAPHSAPIPPGHKACKGLGRCAACYTRHANRTRTARRLGNCPVCGIDTYAGVGMVPEGARRTRGGKKCSACARRGNRVPTRQTRSTATADAHARKAPETLMPSLEGAACAPLERAVPGTAETWYATDERDVARALQVCRICPIRARCLSYAMSMEAEAPGGRYGVWGGLTPEQRGELARRAS